MRRTGQRLGSEFFAARDLVARCPALDTSRLVFAKVVGTVSRDALAHEGPGVVPPQGVTWCNQWLPAHGQPSSGRPARAGAGPCRGAGTQAARPGGASLTARRGALERVVHGRARVGGRVGLRLLDFSLVFWESRPSRMGSSAFVPPIVVHFSRPSIRIPSRCVLCRAAIDFPPFLLPAHHGSRFSTDSL